MGARLQDHRNKPEPGKETPAGCESSVRAKELSELFERHNRTLVSFLVNRLGNEAEAKEVAQEAYVRLLQLDEPGAVNFLRSYLFKTAANIALDRIRHRVRAERLDEVYDSDDLTNNIGPDREALAWDELKMVRQALLELPARYRRAFLLSRFDEKSTEDIGLELCLSDSQIRLYLRRVVAYCRLRMDGLTEAEAKERVFK